MSDCIFIDGSEGEGGGQILRTSLALSLVTGRAFRIERIRAGRAKPGLLRQHLTAVQAAAEISRAHVTGAEMGSQALTFEPGQPRGAEYRFAVGTAGSTTLVLQSVLPALLAAPEPSRVTVEGGTDNPGAPPFDFLSKTFVPLLRGMGASVRVHLERHGFYPAGGGRFVVEVEPSPIHGGLTLTERGDVRVHARACVASLPESIARRELMVVRERLALPHGFYHAETVTDAIGPGNVLVIVMESEQVTEVVTGFGEKGVTAERVASRACDEAAAYLAAGVPVGIHLADQLLIPMAMAGSGAFRTLAPTPHTVTNAGVIRRFMAVPIAFENEPGGTCRVNVGTAAGVAR